MWSEADQEPICETAASKCKQCRKSALALQVGTRDGSAKSTVGTRSSTLDQKLFPVKDSETSETMKQVAVDAVLAECPFWKLPRLKTRKPSGQASESKTHQEQLHPEFFSAALDHCKETCQAIKLTKTCRANSEHSPIQSTLFSGMHAVCSHSVKLCTTVPKALRFTKVAEAAMSRSSLRRLRQLQLQKPRRLYLACMCTTSSLRDKIDHIV